jgi:hypothetical protein
VGHPGYFIHEEKEKGAVKMTCALEKFSSIFRVAFLGRAL